MVMKAADPTTPWISAATRKISENQGDNSKSKQLEDEIRVRERLDDPAAETSKKTEEDIKLIKTMADELDKRFDQLSATQDRGEVQQAEADILKNPELLAKAENMIGDFQTALWGAWKRDTEGYASEVVSAMGKDASEDAALNKVKMIETKNAPDVVSNKLAAISACEQERSELLVLRDKLQTKMTARDFPEKTKLEKTIGKYDALNDGGKLQSEQKAIRSWNDPTDPKNRSSVVTDVKDKVKKDFAEKPFYKKL